MDSQVSNSFGGIATQSFKTPKIAVYKQPQAFFANEKVIEVLLPTEKTIVLAANSSDINPIVGQVDNRKFLILLIDKSLKRLGHSQNDVERLALSVLMHEDLQKPDFKFLTQKEVQYAVEMYIDRAFTIDESEVIYLTSANFVKAIKAYKLQVKQMAFKIYNEKLQKMMEKPVPTHEENIALELAVINGHAKKWLVNSENIDFELNIFSRSHYDNLRKYGIYQMSNEEAFSLLEVVKNRYPRMNIESQKLEASIAAYRFYLHTFLVKPNRKLIYENEKFDYVNL